MKCIILIAFALSALKINAQNVISIESINKWDDTSDKYKVIFINAEWCAICKSNLNLIESSSAIEEAALGEFVFFNLEEEYDSPIQFNGQQYQYVQTGMDTGRHQLIDSLLTNVSYPSFVFLTRTNEIITTYSGFINESELPTILGAILNHIASPDSERNN